MGMVDEQLKDIWKWTTETERTYRRMPHGPLSDALEAVRLLEGRASPMAAGHLLGFYEGLAEPRRETGLGAGDRTHLRPDRMALWLCGGRGVDTFLRHFTPIVSSVTDA